MKNIKVFVAGSTDKIWLDWLPINAVPVFKLDIADLVIFRGGTDINPKLYGHKRLSMSDIPDHKRDDLEIEMYNKAIKLGIKILGICRGSQLVNCLNGTGTLVQHMSHPPVHEVKTKSGFKFNINSSHHQLMVPSGCNFNILAWAENLSPVYQYGDGDIEMKKEPEIVHFPETNCLAIQSHPEWSNMPNKGRIYIKGIVRKFMRDKL